MFIILAISSIVQHRKGKSASKKPEVNRSQNWVCNSTNRFSGLPVEDSRCELEVDWDENIVNDYVGSLSYRSQKHVYRKNRKGINTSLPRECKRLEKHSNRNFGSEVSKCKSDKNSLHKASYWGKVSTHSNQNCIDTQRVEHNSSEKECQKFSVVGSGCKNDHWKGEASDILSFHTDVMGNKELGSENTPLSASDLGDINVINYQYTETNIIENLTKAGKPVAKKVNVLHIHNKSKDLGKCIQQQYKPFGFLPITNLNYENCDISNVPKEVYTWDTFDAIKVYEKVKATGTYNFLQARIQIPTNITLDLLDKVCEGYWDWQLPLRLRYGFPLAFPEKALSSLISSEVNHSSALQFPSDIKIILSLKFNIMLL